MDNKKSRGGKRAGAGRKPITDKKRQITLYIKQSTIELNGGITQVKKTLLNALK